MPTRLKHLFSRLIVLLTIGILASIDFGCASSRLTNEWRDAEFKGPPMTNLLIIAAKRNAVNRRIWEDEIVSELLLQGTKSIPSYRLFADSIPDPDQVATTVRANKFDGVIFVRKLPTEVSTYYVPGPMKSVQVPRYNEHTQTYTSYYRNVQELGSTDTSRIVRHEISVFTTQLEVPRLVWAGTGELLDPSSREEVRHEIGSLVAPELVSQGIIPPK